MHVLDELSDDELSAQPPADASGPLASAPNMGHLLVFAAYHEGTHWDFLSRHGRESREIALSTRKRRQQFAGCLLDRIADPRNLMCAIEDLASKRDKAPGPNGIRLEASCQPADGDTPTITAAATQTKAQARAELETLSNDESWIAKSIAALPD